jgi:heme oxygenase (biliverdin-IX-beta and delta-forming)
MVDVLQLLRAGTATQHADVERALDLMSPQLQRARLIWVLDRLHGFWAAAERCLDDWAERHAADARAVDWPRRRRAGLFADDLRALGADGGSLRPVLARVADTDEALGRLYVLEGSTLGGTVIDRHLARLPHLADVRLRAFSPYGPQTGAMWHAFRRTTRERIAVGGDAAVVVAAARATFGALAGWAGREP